MRKGRQVVNVNTNKVTRRQVEVLRTMLDHGHDSCREPIVRGRGGVLYLGDEEISPSTVSALYKAGLIEERGAFGTATLWYITDAGRTLLLVP